jgi:hypothetical protein
MARQDRPACPPDRARPIFLQVGAPGSAVPYTGPMSAVAESLRADSRARLRRMTAEERVAEALALGRRVVTAYATAHGIDEGEARRRLERVAQSGRLPSRVMRQLAE